MAFQDTWHLAPKEQISKQGTAYLEASMEVLDGGKRFGQRQKRQEAREEEGRGRERRGGERRGGGREGGTAQGKKIDTLGEDP